IRRKPTTSGITVPAAQITAAAVNHITIQPSTTTGRPSYTARTYWYTACHSTTITAPSSTIVAIMNTSPPKDVGIWAAFSVSNCGYSAPKPSAIAPMASVRPEIAARLTTIMNGGTLSKTFVTPVSTSAKPSNGTVPTQYLDQSRARRSSGLERSSHMWRPSSETAGKMKRAAIEASTN